MGDKYERHSKYSLGGKKKKGVESLRSSWDERIRTFDTRTQIPTPYHLATSHFITLFSLLKSISNGTPLTSVKRTVFLFGLSSWS